MLIVNHREFVFFQMDATEFRKFGRAAVDFVADYLENVRERYVCYEFLNAAVTLFAWYFISQNGAAVSGSWIFA